MVFDEGADAGIDDASRPVWLAFVPCASCFYEAEGETRTYDLLSTKLGPYILSNHDRAGETRVQYEAHIAAWIALVRMTLTEGHVPHTSAARLLDRLVERLGDRVVWRHGRTGRPGCLPRRVTDLGAGLSEPA